MFKPFLSLKPEPLAEPVAPAGTVAAQAPRHVAIIMDGNGRWAKMRNLPRAAGHRQGAEALRNMLAACSKLGIEHLTVYAFSAENWNRPTSEIDDLMQLMKHYLKREVTSCVENRIRLRVVGERSRLAPDLRQMIEDAEQVTAIDYAFDFTICFAYGARQEIVRAAQYLAAEAVAGRLDPAAIDERMIEACLYTASMPAPDLLIRTGGEKRMSNFLLWQSAYTELYFTDLLWPDFTAEHLGLAVRDFASRERRYGLTGES